MLLTKNLTPQQHKNIVKELSSNQILAIVEISINILYGNIPLSTTQLQILQPFSKVVKYLAKDTTSLHNKQKYITRNLSGVKEIILAANRHIASIQKQNERDRETSSPTMGEIYPIDKE